MSTVISNENTLLFIVRALVFNVFGANIILLKPNAKFTETSNRYSRPLLTAESMSIARLIPLSRVGSPLAVRQTSGQHESTEKLVAFDITSKGLTIGNSSDDDIRVYDPLNQLKGIAEPFRLQLLFTIDFDLKINFFVRRVTGLFDPDV